MSPSSDPALLVHRRGAASIAVLLVAGLVALLAAPRAHAIFDGAAYAFPVPDYVSGQIGQAALTNTYDASRSSSSSGSKRDSSRREPKPKPRRPTAAQRRTLRFTESPGVTQRIHQTLLDRTGADPAVLIPQREQVKADWSRVLTENLEWSPRDLGDATAFTFIQLNRFYRGQSMLDERAAAAVRRQVRDDLALSSSVRRMSSDRKQTAAEMLQLRTIFLGSALELHQQHGDAAAAGSTKDDIRRFTREIFGIDLRKVKIGKKGLVRT
jgi:hypothetical protein